MAAFINATYIFFTFIFDFVDTLHHMVEHWEEESHTQGGPSKNLPSAHDDEHHIKEMSFYLALFSFLRIGVIGVYLYMESRTFPVHDYMQVNWFNWPASTNKQAIKQKLKEI